LKMVKPIQQKKQSKNGRELYMASESQLELEDEPANREHPEGRQNNRKKKQAWINVKAT